MKNLNAIAPNCYERFNLEKERRHFEEHKMNEDSTPLTKTMDPKRLGHQAPHHFTFKDNKIIERTKKCWPFSKTM